MGNDKTRLGYACAIAAQIAWGLFPIYVDFLKSYDALAIVAHRIIWSFVMLLSLFALARFVRSPYLPAFSEIRAGLSSPRTLLICVIASLLILTNWIAFIWAVLHNHKLDASLGYYICPQIVVLLGVIFLGERLRRLQWIGFALSALGVIYMVQSNSSKPAVSLAVAFSFGFYALFKKRVKLSALAGLTFETGFLLIPGILFLAYHCGYLQSIGLEAGAAEDGLTPTVFTQDWRLNLLLIGTGLATLLPLVWYATAVKHIPLSTVGQLQFIGPTIQFVIGVYLFHEPVDRSRLIGFLVVWAGVGIYLVSLRTIQSSVQSGGKLK